MRESPLTPASVRRSLETIPISILNILPQPRKTFDPDRLETFGKDIKENGLLHPVTVAVYSPAAVVYLLECVNRLWAVDVCLSDLDAVPNNQAMPEILPGGHFPILIAGERRTRAVRDHIEEVEVIDSFLYRNPPVELALRLQLSENNHQQVPPEEQADAYHRLWQLLTEIVDDRSITITEYARMVGRTPQTVRNALRYAGMVEVFKDMVDAGFLQYGHVLQLHRLKQAGLEQNQLRAYAGMAAVGMGAIEDGLTVSDFRAVIDERLRELENNQQTLFGARKEVDKQNRRVAAKKWVNLARAADDYFVQLIDLLQSGLLGELEAPFSPGSPKRRLLSMLDSIEHVAQNLGPEGFSQAKIEELEGRIQRIRKQLTGQKQPQG